jgi:hypothetical protein
VTHVDSFAPRQMLSVRSSTTSISMAGRVPLVPYYPNKAQGSKDYQWMDIYNALGRERWELLVKLFLYIELRGAVSQIKSFSENRKPVYCVS